MNMKVLLSCLLVLVFSQDCLGADIPVYCRVLKINCSKVTRHPCCTETKKEVVEQEQTSPEPTTQQNKDYLEDTYDEYEGGETEEDNTEKDVSDLVTNNQENDEESFSEPDLSFPDTSKGKEQWI